MENKTFELLEKMHSDIQSRFDMMENEIKEVRNEMRKGFVRLENKMDENHKVLYDGI
ncbi:hypothetical protein [Paramaledivibacter caminithermalis]|uniref:Uncharacterized protein n=1 Tax=Paramaledivibacter caminithermalis (strain DSM 15212 / CIP 107654 / DViRD3) TaxID=1121301 RepID=A0A1M6MDT4_PARC5|nr:hypothetical protein [Paramaledivibacter caminithermalis]SHJ81618.1 hypothetical protein SAMN02745912_01186 [Paramaledivibacter caminithermalis DSM 15212]